MLPIYDLYGLEVQDILFLSFCVVNASLCLGWKEIAGLSLGVTFDQLLPYQGGGGGFLSNPETCLNIVTE